MVKITFFKGLKSTAWYNRQETSIVTCTMCTCKEQLLFGFTVFSILVVSNFRLISYRLQQMDVWRVSINHCQFGPTLSCTPIISSQYSKAGCCSPPHPFSQPFVLESCLSDLSDKLQQNCPVCKKQGHLFSICAVNIFILKTDGMFHSLGGLGQNDILGWTVFRLILNNSRQIAKKCPHT